MRKLETSYFNLPQNLKKSYFRHILGNFLTQKPEKRLSKKIISFNFQSLWWSNFIHKITKIWSVYFSKRWKTLILGPFLTHFWSKNVKVGFSHKLKIYSTWSLYAAKHLCKRSGIFWVLIFHKLEKPNFGPILSPFGTKTLEQDFFYSKTPALSHCKFHDTLT